jgi:FkbM family methyltransferase
MRHFIRKVLGRFNFYFKELYLVHIAKNEHAILVRKWYRDTKKIDFRFDQALNSSSIVMDVGGYLGDWSSEINARYHPILYVYEPVPEFFASLESRFDRDKNVHLKKYGLSGHSEVMPISIDADGSSLFGGKTKTIQISIVDVIDEMRQEKINEVDLLKINIEGAEYDLLERIIDSGITSRIKVFQIQFHDFVGDAIARRDKIRGALTLTHTLKYDYPFIWEEWMRKAGE